MKAVRSFLRAGKSSIPVCLVFASSLTLYFTGVSRFINGCAVVGWNMGPQIMEIIYYTIPAINTGVFAGSVYTQASNRHRRFLGPLAFLCISLSLLYIPMIVGAWEHYDGNNSVDYKCTRQSESTIRELCIKIRNGFIMLVVGAAALALASVWPVIMVFIANRVVVVERIPLEAVVLIEDELELENDE